MTAHLDLAYLTGWSRQRQTAAELAAYTDKCRGCTHPWHGLSCNRFACDCPSSPEVPE